MDMRESFSKLKKKIATPLRKLSRHTDPEPAPGGASENSQGKGEADVGGSRRSSHPHPDPEAAAGRGPSRVGSDVDGKKVGPVISGKPNNALRPDEGAAENKSNWESTSSATAKLLLRGVTDSADAFGPLKSVAGSLCHILENGERMKANKQAIKSLAHTVKVIAELLRAPVPEGDIKEESRRKILERKLEDVHRDLTPLAEQGKVGGLPTNAENARRIDGLVEDIREVMVDYQISLQQDIYDKSCQLIEPADLVLLNGIHHAVGAGYRRENRQGCLRGTRKDILLEIENWSKDEQDQRVFWLTGLVGTGKSTIAQTFAETAFVGGNLGASFFCSRHFEDRCDLQKIFPTLAFQLASRYPNFRKELLQVLKTRPDVGRGSLYSQMKKLIVGPFKATDISTLIIIDALDECGDVDPASAILSVLSRYVDEIPKVKFFLTGRPELRIHDGFRLESPRPIADVLKVYEIKPEVVDRDIELFFRTQLASLAKSRSDCNLAEDWPSSSDIEILCKKAAGFFTYASTVVMFIASGTDLPSEMLALITSLPQSTAKVGKADVDQLYITILNHAFHDAHADNSQCYSHFRDVVGTVLLIFNPLSIKGLSELLTYNTSLIRSTVRSLHSLLLVPDGTGDPIDIFHKSFPDFLTDPHRCKDERFFVDPSVHHTEIFLSCLSLMRERLKKNICNLNDHAVLSEVKDLPSRRKDYIGDALEYACRFWTGHLVKIPSSSPRAKEAQTFIKEFFRTHMPYWIEVLVLTGNLGVGIYAMDSIRYWYISAGSSCAWTDDIQCFILEYFDIIRDSPSQIYHSALPLSPSSSWIHECYSAKLLQEVVVVAGLPTKWGASHRTVSFDCTPLTLAQWGNTIAVGLEDHYIAILDAITGIRVAAFSGHVGWVRSLAFSEDGTLLVSGGDDKTINLWDVQTGGVIKTLRGHTGRVLSVSIAPDRTAIVSGSSDGTIRLWDLRTRKDRIIRKDSTPFTSVSFSPKNSQRIISASEKGEVRLWDVDGQGIGPPHDGFEVAYSPDGAFFVSSVGTVRNSETGAEFKLGDPDLTFQHCCFSPDGRLVACATSNTVFVWDISGSVPSLVGNFVGHTEGITSLAFSSCLASASWDQTVKFWWISTSADQNAIDTIPTSSTSVRPIQSISLQAEHGIAITTDSVGMMKIWDLSTGLYEGPFETPARGNIDAQKIDGRVIVVWYDWKVGEPGKVHVWDLEKKELLRTFCERWARAFDLRISGDGSKVFLLDHRCIRGWFISTGKAVGEVELTEQLPRSLIVDGSKVWLSGSDPTRWGLPGSNPVGWDFGIAGSPPILLSDEHPHIPRFDFLDGARKNQKGPPRIEDTITGKRIFHLPERFAEVGTETNVRWNGRYLVVGHSSGEVLILDFSHVCPE